MNEIGFENRRAKQAISVRNADGHKATVFFTCSGIRPNFTLHTPFLLKIIEKKPHPQQMVILDKPSNLLSQKYVLKRRKPIEIFQENRFENDIMFSTSEKITFALVKRIATFIRFLIVKDYCDRGSTPFSPVEMCQKNMQESKRLCEATRIRYRTFFPAKTTLNGAPTFFLASASCLLQTEISIPCVA